MTTDEAIKALYQARKAINALLDAYEGKEKQKRKAAPPKDTRFDEWYNLYPRKVAKPAAHTAWIARDLDQKADDLIRVVKLFAQTMQGKDPKYIPHPSTYLRQERYNDPIDGAEKKPLTEQQILQMMSR